MLDHFTSIFSSFWGIFSFSFVVALTGAMAPGPLLTYTIIQTAKAERAGYLVGGFVIVGHALVEMGIIAMILLGFSSVLENVYIINTIGIVGGLVLILFGVGLLKEVVRGTISTDFLHSSGKDDGSSEKKAFDHPVWGGAMVSMSNPYWWVWWATIGLAFMTRFDISFKNWPGLIVFYIGHEAGDLLWYALISALAFWGIRFINRKVYCGILACCGIFMIVFGVYLGGMPLSILFAAQ